MQTINRFILLKTFVSTQKTFDYTQKHSFLRKNIRFYAKTFDSTQNIRFYAKHSILLKTFDSTQKHSIRRKKIRFDANGFDYYFDFCISAQNFTKFSGIPSSASSA